MKKQTRRKFTPVFKAKVALEAVKNQHTLAELAIKYEVSPVIISRWKSEFLENMSAALKSRAPKQATQLTPRNCMPRPWAAARGK